jgi:hypothetical protein
MQRVLEALELLAKHEHPLTKIQVRKPPDGGSIVTVYPHQVATDAAELLRERLAQPEQEPVPEQRNYSCKVCGNKPDYEGVLEHGRGCYVMQSEGGGSEYIAAACKKPEQEPVGDEWTPCMKLPVVVHVRKQRFGEAHVSTREGITPVKPDDLIMRGVSGEEYPIGRAIFEQTYSLNTTPPQRTEQEPSGWKLVPIEPTQEMLRATEAGPVNYPSFCWKAMLSAAPNTPQHKPLIWLSQEEERQIKDHCTTVACVLRAVKAKLKEKNT